MQDLDDVRKALGYNQINIYGVSYGTRSALAYLRHYGDSSCDVLFHDDSAMRITREQVSQDGYLKNYFGGELQTEPQKDTIDFSEGSRALLCTDGISFYFSCMEMIEIGHRLKWDASALIEEIFTLSLRAGSSDDRTIVYAY